MDRSLLLVVFGGHSRHQDFLMRLKGALETAGYDVLPAENEEQAESVMREHRRDLWWTSECGRLMHAA